MAHKGLPGNDGADGQGVPIGGTANQLLAKIDETDFNTEWITLGTSYAPLSFWAEESAATAANAYEWAFGNGDDAASGGGIVIPVDCELYSISSSASSANDGFRVNIKKNTTTVATSDAKVGQTELTELSTPVSFSKGDVLDFQTHTAGISTAGTRVVANFRVAVIGQKGDAGPAGADGDMTWEGAWSAGTYLQNQVVENNGSSYVCIATSTTQQPPDTDWELVAEKGDTGPSGSTAPYAHLVVGTAKNHGGANGAISVVDWDGTTIHKDTGFTHSTSTNPSRVQVDADGRYSVYWNVGITQGGSARTTFMSSLLINGATENKRGRERNYSRGSGYGDTSVGMSTEIDLTNGDYIEARITIDDTDGIYTSNSIPLETELIIRKIA